MEIFLSYSTEIYFHPKCAFFLQPPRYTDQSVVVNSDKTTENKLMDESRAQFHIYSHTNHFSYYLQLLRSSAKRTMIE